eukprot:GHVS01052081.1.p1 GENE.GHVS01052081.1~~GHVS01052081.1.p1  ORF type:complete len:140 (+),score=22.97 GHVS01052081.1:222-641(+)
MAAAIPPATSDTSPTELNANFDALGKQFAEQYFNSFTANRGNIEAMFRAQSMLSWEGQQFQGSANVMKKISELPTMTYKLASLDCQPACDNGILIVVAGDVKIDDNSNAMKFMQVFVLRRTSTGTYYIFNTIFRLNLDA